jgi:hypothetical protein
VAEGPAPAGSGTPPAGIDPAQVAAALRVGQIAGQLGRGQVREQLLSLVHEYNVTRAAMPYSQHRTQLLDGVVARMRVLSAAAGWMLPQLIRAGTPGERLAAIAILQMQPDPAFVTWLEERCHTEQAFLQYHAAIALRNAADSLGEEHHPALRLSIERALAKSRDSSTRKVLESAQEILAGAGASGAA